MSAGCPYCQVLHPGVSPCPRCDGKPRFHAAQMLDPAAIRSAVVRAVDTYDHSRPQLHALLRLLFVHRPRAEQALAEDGRLSLKRLADDEAEFAARDNH